MGDSVVRPHGRRLLPLLELRQNLNLLVVEELPVLFLLRPRAVIIPQLPRQAYWLGLENGIVWLLGIPRRGGSAPNDLGLPTPFWSGPEKRTSPRAEVGWEAIFEIKVIGREL